MSSGSASGINASTPESTAHGGNLLCDCLSWCGLWLGKLTFNIIFGILMLPAATFALVLDFTAQLRTCCCRENSKVGQHGCCSKILIGMVVVSWRLTLLLSCWIRVHVDGLDVFQRSFGSSGRPSILLMNHTSFLDSILAVSLTPLFQAVRVRGFMARHLFHAPILGSLLRAMGQVEVPFTKDGGDNGFQVERQLMDARMRDCEEHLRKGGNASWYPEGAINKDPRKIQKFRAGGFILPARVDVEVWCMAFVGNPTSWPRGGIGGGPARIGIRVWRLCESSHEFQTTQRAFAEENCVEEKDKAICWAKNLERTFQKVVDELIAEGFCCGTLPASETTALVPP